MNVVVIGPNLRNEKGEFVVHAEGCADIERIVRRNGLGPAERGWTVPVETALEVSEDIYGDMIDEGSMTAEDGLSEIYFAPCLKNLK